ncbi:TetR/AcrR family transcriptional regulator [Acinetobacter tandoii]|nr:TetR/AcrR family transcriptional regulator [Acinetobacter tandoii]
MRLSSSQQRIHKAALKLFAEKGSTNVSVSELADAAGVARGTIYNNGLNPETLFEDIATLLATEMNARVIKTLEYEQDSAVRLAQGVRMYLRRAHDEPDWGRFICKFAFSAKSMMGLWTASDSPLPDVIHGLEQGRYQFKQEQLMSVIALIAGTVLSSIFLVLEGYKTWRDSGSDIAELLLIALGVDKKEANEIARSELPILQEL